MHVRNCKLSWFSDQVDAWKWSLVSVNNRSDRYRPRNQLPYGGISTRPDQRCPRGANFIPSSFSSGHNSWRHQLSRAERWASAIRAGRSGCKSCRQQLRGDRESGRGDPRAAALRPGRLAHRSDRHQPRNRLPYVGRQSWVPFAYHSWWHDHIYQLYAWFFVDTVPWLV